MQVFPSIAGADVQTERHRPIVDPATGEVIGRAFHADASHVREARDAALKAFAVWGRMSSTQRRPILKEIAARIGARSEEIAAIITLEIGKPLAEARAEIAASAAAFDWAADDACRIASETIDGIVPGNRVEVRREPIGVVLALTPWNFPFNLPARKLAPALAAGCPVILRPAPEAAASAAALVSCCLEAGLPPGAVNLLIGDHATTVTPLMADPEIRCVSFTGSTRVGRLLIEQSARTVKHLVLELGGHAPVIVLADADVEKAARTGAAAKFRNAGQVCVSPTRFIVDRSIHDDFVATFIDAASRLKIGRGTEPDITMGPLATARQVDHVERLIGNAVDGGARIAYGGRRAPDAGNGYFFQPTVLVDVPSDAEVRHVEPFGPIAIIESYSDLDEAITLANANEAGLAGYVFGTSQDLVGRVCAGLEVGVLGVNTMALSAVEAPFGGVKQSGYGKEGGRDGIEEFQIVKTLHVATSG